VPQPRLRDIWAKSPIGAGLEGESLVDHTTAVLRTLGALRGVNPELPERVAQPEIWNWIYWACALHDFGKCASGFQRQLREPFHWDYRHEVLSLAFLPLVAAPSAGLGYGAVAAGIVAHHKDADTIAERYPLDTEMGQRRIGDMLGQVTEEEVELLARWVLELRQNADPIGDVDAVKPRAFAGRFHRDAPAAIEQALYDYQRLVHELHAGRQRPLLLASMALRGLVMSADHIGSAHKWAAISKPFRLDVAAQVRPREPWPHQAAAERVDGSAMFIAPTGSGKTETALLWAVHQDALRKVSHLFYVLPYQASMNAMYQRLQPAVQSAALIHGRALEATYRQLLDTDNSKQTAARKAHAVERLAKLQVHGARVLSPYQLLKAIFRLRGYESLAADFFDGAFIYDEVHAYEPQRLALIIGQMGDLARRFGARMCVMSATLPTFLQEWLRQEIECGEPIRASDEVFRRFRRHRLAITTGDLLDHLPEIADRAKDGSVLVCCNTVGRAQQAYDGLLRLGIEPVLLHSRFSARDRLRKEGVLEPGREQRVVMVATQVVEVSLNVSFATIYTDPAPLEALFQRFGRVNRFCNLDDLAHVHVFTHPTNLRVYSNSIVTRAVEVLSGHDGEPIDEREVGDWLDEQYTPDILEPIQRDYSTTLRLTKQKINRLAPFQSDRSLRDEFFEMFDSVEVLPTACEAEYDQLQDAGETIEADSLLVPIRWTQFARLRGENLTRRPDPEGPPVADVPYDDKYGLRL